MENEQIDPEMENLLEKIIAGDKEAVEKFAKILSQPLLGIWDGFREFQNSREIFPGKDNNV